MQHIKFYHSIIGKIILTADDIGLTGLWFADGKYSYLEDKYIEASMPIFDETIQWLDIYFSGKVPNFTPKMHLEGSPFRLLVWDILKTIPHGKIMTYKDVANITAMQLGISRMSAQAVGGAIGRNKISIIIPCHRIVGSDGALTGYAGGLDKKSALLNIENVKL